ncbi:MAG: NUDIX domain-containing protein [bacterium]|nr:NUDIX domain-containing protein [bacterium]
MRVILVVARRHLFPGLSPQGFLPPGAVDLESVAGHLFFAERDYMEQCSHYKQVIPYLVLTRGQGPDARVLCYQRRSKHTEARLGGLWSLGFGGHIEPEDSVAGARRTASLLEATALREMEEETGLQPGAQALRLAGFINSDAQDVSSVHFGVVYRVTLDALSGTDDDLVRLVSAQAEPHQARWIPARDLCGLLGEGGGPDGGSFEDWSRIAARGLFGET